MESRPWFRFWVSDFFDDDEVRVLTAAEVGLYMLLLGEQWRRGVLRDDADYWFRVFASRFQDRRAFDVAWASVRPRFDACDGGMANRRLEEERGDAAAAAKRRSERASRAARIRWSQPTGAHAPSMPDASGEHRSSTGGASGGTRKAPRKRSGAPRSEHAANKQGQLPEIVNASDGSLDAPSMPDASPEHAKREEKREKREKKNPPAKPREPSPQQVAVDLFAGAYLAVTGEPYPAQRADFVQVAKLVKALGDSWSPTVWLDRTNRLLRSDARYTNRTARWLATTGWTKLAPSGGPGAASGFEALLSELDAHDGPDGPDAPREAEWTPS